MWQRSGYGKGCKPYQGSNVLAGRRRYTAVKTALQIIRYSSLGAPSAASLPSERHPLTRKDPNGVDRRGDDQDQNKHKSREPDDGHGCTDPCAASLPPEAQCLPRTRTGRAAAATLNPTVTTDESSAGPTIRHPSTKHYYPRQLQSQSPQADDGPMGHGGGRDGNVAPRDAGYSRDPQLPGARERRRWGDQKEGTRWEMGDGVHDLRGSSSSSGNSSSSNNSKRPMAGRGEAKRINLAIMEAGTRRNFQEILQLVSERGQDCNGVNVATALHRLASCGLQPGSQEAKRVLADSRFSHLAQLAEYHVMAFGPREVSNCLWALAKLGYQSEAEAEADSSQPRRADGVRFGGNRVGRLLEVLCARASGLLPEFQQQEVTNTLWALGTLGHYPGEGLLRNLSRRLLEVLHETTPQGIASSLLGLAKLEWSPGPGVLDEVARGSLAKIGDFNAQALSNTMWSLARLGHYNDQLQTAIFRQALRVLPEFNPQGIANLVWAAATLGLMPSEGGVGGGRSGGGKAAPAAAGYDSNDGADSYIGGLQQQQQQQQQPGDIPVVLLRKFCDQAAATLQDYTPQNVSNLLWSSAKLGYVHEGLLRAAASQAAKQLAEEVAEEREVPGPEVGLVEPPVTATSGAGRSGSGTAARPGVRVSSRGGAPKWKSQEVANAVWAYATLDAQPGPNFLRQVCRHLSSVRHLPGYKWQELANVLWALATLQFRDCTGALAVVETEVVARLGRVNATREQDRQQIRAPRPPDVSMLMWSYASLQQPAPDLFTALLPIFTRRLSSFSDAELNCCIWAAAKLGVYDEAAMDTVAGHICSYRLPYLHIHNVASIAWSYNELRHAHKPLFDGLVARAVSYPPPPASSASLSVSATDMLGILSHFTRICFAVGVFGWSYPTLMEATMQRLTMLSRCAFIRTGTGTLPGAGASVASAAGHIRNSSADAMSLPNVGSSGGAAAVAAAQRLELVVPNLCWGLSLMGSCSPQIWSQMMELLGRLGEARRGGEEGVGGLDLPDEALRQLYQAYMHVQCDYPNTVLAVGPVGLLERAAEVWRFRSTWGAQVSLLHQQVSEALTRLDLKHTVERIIDNGDFSIDLAVEMKLPDAGVGVTRRGVLSAAGKRELRLEQDGLESGTKVRRRSSRKSNSSKEATTVNPTPTTPMTGSSRVIRIAVEVDGPSHFTSNTRQPLGPTIYHRRILEDRGWRVVSVPYWIWNQAGSRPEKQDALLVALMNEAGSLNPCRS